MRTPACASSFACRLRLRLRRMRMNSADQHDSSVSSQALHPERATDSLELAQRSRAFAATLVALRGAADGTAGGGLLPDISTSGGGRASYNHTLSASRLPAAMPRLDRLTNAFVNDFKRAHKQRPACLKIQAAWRMHVQRRPQ